MSDLVKATTDVTIFSADGATPVSVTVDNEAKVFDARVGEVQINPSDYTVLWRLKQIADELNTGITIGENRWQDATAQGQGYVVGSNNITIAGLTESDFILIHNPANSGKVIRIYKCNFGNESGTTAPSVWRMYRDCTHTNLGTALAINNLKKGGPASAMNAYKVPTISARGTFLAGDAFTSIGMDLVFDLGQYVMPNEYLLLTIDASTGNAIHHAIFYWVEEPI